MNQLPGLLRDYLFSSLLWPIYGVKAWPTYGVKNKVIRRSQERLNLRNIDNARRIEMMNDSVIQSIKESVLCWLATIDRSGAPNVSPKEIWCSYGTQTVLVADIASSGSVSNIRSNPAVCLSFVHVFKQKGYKLKGKARIVAEGSGAYFRMHATLFALAGERFPISNVIEIAVEEVAEILAPSYHLYPATTQSEQIENAMRTYGVRPDPKTS